MWIRALEWSLEITLEFGSPQSGWPPKNTKLPGCHLKSNGQKPAVKSRDAAVRSTVTGKTAQTPAMVGREKSQEMQVINTQDLMGFSALTVGSGKPL